MFGSQMNLTQEDSPKHPSIHTSHPLEFRLTSFKWQIVKDEIAFIGLFILAIIAVYYMPQSVSKILFVGLLILFWNSKKDYLWFAFFFVLVQMPGFFFVGFSKASLYSLPVFTLMRTMFPP